MAKVENWSIRDVKAECFSGDNQADILNEINAWLSHQQDIQLLGISCGIIEDTIYMTVFYE